MGDYGFGDNAGLKRNSVQTNDISSSKNEASNAEDVMGTDRAPPTYSEATKGHSDVSNTLDVSPNFERSNSWDKVRIFGKCVSGLLAIEAKYCGAV